MDLLNQLYALVHQLVDHELSFQSFYKPGLDLLQDFNIIDQNLVNGVTCLGAVADSYIFNKNIQPQGPSALDKIYKNLSTIYQNFTQHLMEKGIGYQGLCYRMAANIEPVISPIKAINYVGFNRFLPAEEQFIHTLKQSIATNFFWDIHPYYFKEPHLAGYYLRKYQSSALFQDHIPCIQENHLPQTDKKIIFLRTNSSVEQIQFVLDNLNHNTHIPLNQKAIIIGSTDLIIPLLDKLEKAQIPIHCQIDYPIYGTLIYHCLIQFVQIWNKYAHSNTGYEPHLYHDLKNTLLTLDPLLIPQGNILLCNQILEQWPTYKTQSPPNYLSSILHLLEQHWDSKQDLYSYLNKEAICTSLTYLSDLDGIGQELPLEAMLGYLKRSTLCYSQHNPATGLHVIDILRSENLDFELIYTLGMNEGQFPKIAYEESLLNHTIRHNFDIEPAKHILQQQTAYNFYRLLQHATITYCCYSQQPPSAMPSEISRLLLQLQFDSPFVITKHQAYHHHHPHTPSPINVIKDTIINQLLDKFIIDKTKTTITLTPSVLIMYLTCPLQFYFSHLLKVSKPKPLLDNQEAIQLGNLFHRVMARLYHPLISKPLDRRALQSLQSAIRPIVQEELGHIKHDTKDDFLGTITEKLAERIIALDMEDPPSMIWGIEFGQNNTLTTALQISQKESVQLGGIIDRMDAKDDHLRIIDYKTSRVCNKFESIQALFDSKNIEKYKAIFQILFYAWLFKKANTRNKQAILPNIIQIREIFSKDYNPHLYIKTSSGKASYKKVEDITPYMDIFQEELTGLIGNMLDASKPISQTDNIQVCQYCPYKLICQRNEKY